MSEFICYIEAEKVDASFVASSNHRGNESRDFATSKINREHAALELARLIGRNRNMQLVAFSDMADGTWKARYSAAPEMEGA